MVTTQGSDGEEEKKSTNSEEGKGEKRYWGSLWGHRRDRNKEQLSLANVLKACALIKELWGTQQEELEVLMHNKVWDLTGVTETYWEFTQLKY